MKTYQKKWQGVSFILPSFIGVIAFILFPFLDVIRRSFLSAVNNKWIWIDNYKIIFQNEAYKLAVRNTLKFTGICIPLLFVLSLFVATILFRQSKWVHGIKSAFLLPMAIPVASVVLVWNIFFDYNGMFNGLLHIFGREPVDWMNTRYALAILIGSYLWKNIGYNIILWLAGMACIPTSQYEAARVDGAGKWKCFWYITLPNLFPSMYMIAVLSLLNSFKVFREVYLVAGDYPHDSIYTMQHLMNNWFRDLALDKMAAGAVVNAVVILVLMIILRRIWKAEESI